MKRRRIPISSLPEYKILNEVTRLDTLKPRIERFDSVEEHLMEARNMQHEITQLGRFVEARGFTRDRHFQRVARIPSSVWSAVLECFPDAGADKQVFYALLEGPLRDYDLRRKPTLT